MWQVYATRHSAVVRGAEDVVPALGGQVELAAEIVELLVEGGFEEGVNHDERLDPHSEITFDAI